MEEIFLLIKAVNRLEDRIINLITKIDIILKSPLRKITLDEKSASKVLGISERTLITLRSQGKIPFLKINRRTLYRSKDLLNFLEENVLQNNQKPKAS